MNIWFEEMEKRLALVEKKLGLRVEKQPQAETVENLIEWAEYCLTNHAPFHTEFHQTWKEALEQFLSKLRRIKPVKHRILLRREGDGFVVTSGGINELYFGRTATEAMAAYVRYNAAELGIEIVDEAKVGRDTG